VQEGGRANDGDEWCYIDEGRWKERGREEDRRWWWADSCGGPNELIGNVDVRQRERGRELVLAELGWLLYFSIVPAAWPGSFVKDL